MRQGALIGSVLAVLVGLSAWAGRQERLVKPGLHEASPGRIRILDAGFPKRIVDGAGFCMTIPRPPRRIVSTTLMTDELLLDLVGPERIAAVTHFADDPTLSNAPEAARGLPVAGTGSVERVIALEPDLVLAARFLKPEFADLLQRSGVPVLNFDRYETLAEIRENLLILGSLLGEEERARTRARAMDETLERARHAADGAQAPPRVLYYTLSGYTLGAGTVFDEILALAGGPTPPPRRACRDTGRSPWRPR